MLPFELRTILVFFIAVSGFVAAMPNGSFAVPLGQPCSGTAACDRGLWCEPQPGACASNAGICVSLPRLCIARKKGKASHPVCGCNGKTYSSDCIRRAQRIGKSHDGKC